MTLFKSIRPLVAIAAELRRIATVMEYFAIADARINNRMFIPSGKRNVIGKDESELLHSDDFKSMTRRNEREALFLQGGHPLVEKEEENG